VEQKVATPALATPELIQGRIRLKWIWIYVEVRKREREEYEVLGCEMFAYLSAVANHK